uniref:DUF952 domain-containing protein n=1 Tax=Chromera velia CCMP2878 TaxID=1169474 RepID=A0A0G4I3B9_9ALVE|eukprot:Cvel_10629.t1-p1 / transcript=Cvel_10629.t1 / gene=Cvel_10629 / organism=Chromera_velia_CCMP2878 / gene_product=hypothetical protein / transcript_product=hypothetical protein / location=Cvel_scaffold645:51405-52240(-) / protein_length=191 / sequence_SO=supercontig / SO=protein_coding / is_pseudo=false
MAEAPSSSSVPEKKEDQKPPRWLFKIVDRAETPFPACDDPQYISELDAKDGFIHTSHTLKSAQFVAENFFPAASNLALLVIDPELFKVDISGDGDGKLPVHWSCPLDEKKPELAPSPETPDKVLVTWDEESGCAHVFRCSKDGKQRGILKHEVAAVMPIDPADSEGKRKFDEVWSSYIDNLDPPEEALNMI